MKFASWFGALVAASECGPVVVTDGHFPDEFRAVQKTHSVDHAILFDITYANTFKVLNNKMAEEQYVLTMCNNVAPEDEEVEKVAPLGDGFVRKHFQVPLKTFGSDTSGNLGYMDVLDVFDRQKYISQYAVPPCLQKMMQCAEAKGESMLSAADIDGDADAKAAERVRQIDSVDGYFRSYGDPDSPKTIAVHDYLDPHMLNRAEWSKFVGAFFNKEDVAEKHMAEQEKRWDTLSKEADAGPKPLVAWISASGYYGQFRISLAAYKVVLSEAAGGTMFTVDDFSSNEHAVVTGVDPNPTIAFNMTDPVAAQAFRDALADVEVLVDESYTSDPQSYNAESFQAGFGFDGAGKSIWRIDGKLGGTRGHGNDWYTGARVDPAGVLSDFIAAFHSTGASRTWVREISESSTVMTPEDCEEELPVCDGVEPAFIDAPCVRHDTCPTEAPTTAIPEASGSEMSGIAAALLLAAAA